MDTKDEYSPEETAERMDRALRRALRTPPKPHKPKKRAPSKGRVRNGKSRS